MSPTTRPFLFVFAASLLILVFAASTQIYAFGGPPGGPFGSGSYFPNDGTFSAVLRGTNLSGVLQFSTTAGAGPNAPTSSSTNTVEFLGLSASQTQSTEGTGGIGSTGIANIYFNGRTYLGNSQGYFNPTNSGMAINFQASMPGQGEQEIVVQTPVTVDVPIVITENGTTTVVTTQETQFVPSRQIKYFDSYYVSGFAECKTSNAFPNQKFKGKGEIVSQELGSGRGNFDPIIVQSEPTKISVTGVRLSNTASSFNRTTVRPPSVNSSTILVSP